MDNREKRNNLRLDKLFPVSLSHPLFGRLRLLARNVSAGGMFVETSDPLPLGSEVKVHFASGEIEIVARAEVRNHYFLNYADRSGPRALAGMGLRFLGFEAGADWVKRLVH